MVSNKTLKQLKDKSIPQRLLKFHPEKRFVRIEKSNEQPKDILRKRFYVSMPSNHYAVGTFGGFNYGYFKLKIEDVFESKKKCMKHLHAGLE